MRALILFLLLFSSQLLAKSDDPIVYLTWKNDPTTTMTVMWITEKSETSDQIYYQKKSKSSDWAKEEGSHWNLPYKKPFLIHKVELKNLEPDTKYNFHFGNKKNTLAFRTMPKNLDRPIRFIAGGDAYNNNFKRFQTMTRRAAKENPRFAIVAGDIAYSAPKGSGSSKMEERWEKWRTFFYTWSKEMVDSDGCLIPILTTIGNHEVMGRYNRSMKEAPFYYLFFEKSSYSMSFGNYANIIFLDSGHTQKIDGKQTKWLKSALEKSKKYKHRFATYHVGAYPSSGNINSKESKLVRKHWVPLFEKYNVHACFENHDHAYKRTYPLIDGKKKSDGVVYFGDGSWGVKPRAPKDRPYLAKKAESQQVLVIELSKNERKFWAVDPKGKMLDSYEQKAD